MKLLDNLPFRVAIVLGVYIISIAIVEIIALIVIQPVAVVCL